MLFRLTILLVALFLSIGCAPPDTSGGNGDDSSSDSSSNTTSSVELDNNSGILV